MLHAGLQRKRNWGDQGGRDVASSNRLGSHQQHSVDAAIVLRVVCHCEGVDTRAESAGEEGTRL